MLNFGGGGDDSVEKIWALTLIAQSHWLMAGPVSGTTTASTDLLRVTARGKDGSY